MRNIKNHIWSIVFVLGISTAFAQTPPPPNNNGGGSSSPGTTPVGGGAPIDNDLYILITAAISYALFYQLRKKKKIKNDVLKL